MCAALTTTATATTSTTRPSRPGRRRRTTPSKRPPRAEPRPRAVRQVRRVDNRSSSSRARPRVAVRACTAPCEFSRLPRKPSARRSRLTPAAPSCACRLARPRPACRGPLSDLLPTPCDAKRLMRRALARAGWLVGSEDCDWPCSAYVSPPPPLFLGNQTLPFLHWRRCVRDLPAPLVTCTALTAAHQKGSLPLPGTPRPTGRSIGRGQRRQGSQIECPRIRSSAQGGRGRGHRGDRQTAARARRCPCLMSLTGMSYEAGGVPVVASGGA